MEQVDFMDGFNLYQTDEEALPGAGAKRLRYCLLCLLATLAFICGVWIVDSTLDWVDKPIVAASRARDHKIAQLKTKTGHLEERLEKLLKDDRDESRRVAPSVKQPPKAVCEDKYHVYIERCSLLVTSPPVMPPDLFHCTFPSCFLNDVDLGFSGFAGSWQKTCVSVPSLAHAHVLDQHGSPVQCASDLTQVRETNQYPPEIHESYEWTCGATELIHLELWGGGGGGAGSTDARICFRFC